MVLTLDEIQSAQINEDGTLGNFSFFDKLEQPVYDNACAISRNLLYVIGGFNYNSGIVYDDIWVKKLSEN